MVCSLLVATIEVERISHMSPLDWVIAVAWIIGTCLFGMWFVSQVRTAQDYLVAGRKLKWWQIGLAQAADAVDANDFIAIAGLGWIAGYTGLGYIWIGVAVGTFILSRYLAPMYYRSGVVTNAEFLELRFNAPMRVASALIQTFYRFIALALCGYAMATMFNVIVGTDRTIGIVIAMCLTISYVFAAGQLGVVMAAVPQMLLMLVVSAIVFVSIYLDIGGLAGFNENRTVYGDMLSLTYYTTDGLNNTVYLIGLVLVLFAYPLVNQTVAQRIVSADSEADARKGSIVSIVPWCIVTGVAIMGGIVGRVLMPDITEATRADLYPEYMVRYLGNGVLGLGVAALVLGSMSTGAGIGTAISGLMTNDVFKIINSDKYTDRQKLWWTRGFAAGSIVLGSLLATLVDDFDGMVPFYTAFTGTFVLPLTVPYLAAAFCPWASRWSAVAAVVGGCMLGLVLFLPSLLALFINDFDPDTQLPFALPFWMTHPQVRPIWVLSFASVVLIVWSLAENAIYGSIRKTSLAARLNAFDLGRSNMTAAEVEAAMANEHVGTWPSKANADYSQSGIREGMPWYANPGLYETLVVIALVVVIVLLW